MVGGRGGADAGGLVVIDTNGGSAVGRMPLVCREGRLLLVATASS